MYYFVVFTQFLVFSTTQVSLKIDHSTTLFNLLYWFAVLLMINMLQSLIVLWNKCDSIMQTQVIRINGV